MPDHIEVETQELQERIQELNEEREERSEDDKKYAWVRYIGLSTAILAVFAAVSALQSGNLVNEALIHQLKASDTWNQYQASRQKDHLYTLTLNDLIDNNSTNRAMIAAVAAPAAANPAQESKPAEGNKPAEGAKPAAGAKPAEEAKPAPRPAPAFAPKAPALRAAEYRAKVMDEMSKEDSLSREARNLETESAEEIEHHHRFEYAVALMQVAIALGAVSALTRVKPVWYFSLLGGLAGVLLFMFGFAG